METLKTFFDSTIPWACVSVAVLIIAIVTSRKFTKHALDFTAALDGSAKKSSEEIQEIIRERLSPRIHLHDGADSVARRAAQIIDLVVAEENLAKITFYGAASMAAVPEDSTAKAEADGRPKPPSDIYFDAMKRACQSNVRMTRYISLFTAVQLHDRSKHVRARYLKWLNRQYELLGEHESYQLAHAVRGPQWGTNMARIITRQSVMEITGNGSAAIVITDEHMAERIRKYAEEAVSGTNQPGRNTDNDPIFYGLAMRNVADFKEYVDTVTRICKDEVT